MVRLCYLTLISVFSVFQTDSAAASKSSEEISAIIHSYADAFTTHVPDRTQHVTTQIYPSIEVQDREYVHDLTKAKDDDKLLFSSSKPISSEEFSSISAQENSGSEELEGTANHEIPFLEHENPQVFTSVVPDETQQITTRLYPAIERQLSSKYGPDFTEAKYDNNPALSNAHLNAAASNQYTSFKDFSSASSEESKESYEPREPAYHVIPFSEHENPKEPSTRTNYTAPGVWAKPPPDKNIPLDFLPTKLLAQVRDSHTVRHLPREYAMESAETSEEKENAARLKEVLKESKANTIYTEEGYEDAAYDHAGHIRDADFQEDFARKLNEELERNKSYSGKKKQPQTYKNHKLRKHRQHTHSNLSQNNKKPSKVAKRARKLRQKIDPKHYRLLKSALNQPVINPKVAVESGIVELEKDLRNEYREGQRTSTEPYTYTTIATPTTFEPPATKSVFESKMDFETTTMRHNVFTIRPRKTFVTVTPKPHRNKLKKPLKSFSVSPHIDNYNAYTTSSHNHDPTQLPSTVDYGKFVWGYLGQNQNATPRITYPPQHFEQQSENPLTVATVNGHGPYLVVVTAPPETLTPIPSESQNFVSTVGYDTVNDYNITQPIVVDSNIRYNSFIPINRKVNRMNYNSEPQALHTNTDVSKPMSYKRGKIKHRDIEPKLDKLKSQTLSESNPNYIEGNRDSYLKYYTALQSTKNPNVPITYSNYNRQPNANWFNQWPNIFNNAQAVESYGLNGIPSIESQKPKGASLVTRLLAPAPLSASEYATFQRQNREVKPITSTVMEIIPIIDAIHKHEHEQSSFPFLFRRKRSTFGFFRSPNFKPKERKDRETDKIEDLSQVSNKSNNTKYPANFQSLLNESPHVAAKEIDAEIKRRFKNGTEAFLGKKLSSEELAPDKKTPSKSRENVEGGDTVEVQVPSLDFTSVFERDEIEPTTQESRVDTKKYPFYTDSSELRNTALKYIVNPKEVPKKTLGGMEFYNSRILECEEVNPDLEKIIPEDEELANKRGPQKKKSRLHGLGHKIDCYKAKYFDESPFDNPLFIEKEVEMPPPPSELNPKAFASRILELPVQKDEYTIPKGPKNPEFVNVKRGAKVRRPFRHPISELDVRQHLHPKLRKPNLININTQRYRYPPKNPVYIGGRMKPAETRSKMKNKVNNLKVVPPYQRLVYEDVMGNIMNLDKSQKSHVPKRGIASTYSKHYKRDNTRQQGITGFKKLKTVSIDGLVPPPQKITDKIMNNKHRYNFTEGVIKNMRIYKRSTSLKDYQNLSSEEANDNVNKKDKAIFRIVFTTPVPRTTPSNKQTQNLDKKNATIAKKQIHTFSHIPRHSNRSGADSGRHGKFSTNEKSNSSAVTRRKEPKYNLAQKVLLPNKTSITYGESAFASSTLIPVMVNLYENFTARIPRGSKNNQAKKQVAEESDRDNQSDEPKEVDDNLNLPNEHEEDPKKQFVVFDPVESKNKNKSNDDTITTHITTADLDNHKELAEFLKGNPPGYDEAFTEEYDPMFDKKKESYEVKDENLDVKSLTKNEESRDENLEMQKSANNEEGDDENSESEIGDAELVERKEEMYEESATDDSPKEAEENEPSDEDDEEEEKSTKDNMQEDKPFVRFSSRPESPPESFEDERYADLGPRVNKPYFYHPPFDVPTYEKYALGKSMQDHNGDDFGHEETEYHEKYVFPWERDDEKDENKEESEHYSSLDQHEFPWEKRERQDKERQKREKTHKTYGKKNADSNYGPDSYSKASNIELVYTPSKNKYLRGKKDVNALQSDPENSAKFSSKYKSSKIKDLMTDEKNKVDIDKSIIKYIKNINISTPKDESSYTTSKKNIKDLDGENISPDTLNKNTEALVMDSNTQKSLNTLRSFKVDNVGRTVSTKVSSTRRPRSRTRKVNTNSIKRNETVLSDITNLPQVQPTLSPKITRQRGRNRSSVTMLTTTTTTTVKPNIRKRNRQASTSTLTRTTPISVNKKRRRGFQITPYTSSNTDSTTSPTSLTSTGRTVEREHRSRVSKEMIITKTVEDNDGDDQDEDTDKNISSRVNKKSPSRVVESNRSKIRHRQQTKNIPDNENPTKTERVEKVTITMEETPDHVYETKEIDKNGIKGKFITITTNNNSVKAVPTNRSRGRTGAVDDAEMEEMQRRMEAFKSFDSVIQDTEALEDEPSSFRTAEKYLVGSLLQKLPLPLSRKNKGEKEDNKDENNNNENEYEEEDEDENEDDEDVGDNEEEEEEEEVDENDKEDTDSEDLDDKKVNADISRSNNTGTIEENPSVIKDPNNRNYYYVETA